MIWKLMSRAHAAREIWHPKSTEEKAAVLRELEAILNSPQFRNSKRYPALLEYIVKNTLAGNSDQLKERTLGVEVFDRPPTYDTNADTIVRYTAGEVRKRLLLYYSDGGEKSTLRISLPAGSYVPEFAFELDETEAATHSDHSHEAAAHEADAGLHAAADTHEPQVSAADLAHIHADSAAVDHSRRRNRALWIAAAVVVLLAAVAGGLLWRSRALHPATAVDQFWAPVLRDQRNVVICTGSVVFAQDHNYSGVHTANKDPDYTFVSMQIASAIAQVTDIAERSGISTQVVPSASMPLTQLGEHPVILLGGYNNQWTMRLLEPLRFHFRQGQSLGQNQGPEAILDRSQPAIQWQRDRSLPYSSADDYAVVARFRNSTIDNWVVALAGLGRNGTEAATLFATSPHYMEMLRSQIGRDFDDKNIEVVLKVSVVEGKSGAPSILAVYAW
jgi:hypothetical protein